MKYRPLMVSCLGIFVVSFLLTHIGKERFIQELRPSPLVNAVASGTNITISGSVYKKEHKSEYQLLYLKELSIIDSNHSQQVLQEPKLILYDNTMTQVNIGNRIRAEGNVSFMESAGNPGNFDEKMYWQKQGIQVKVWSEEIKIENAKIDIIKNKLSIIREKWKNSLYEAIGEEDGAIMSGIMLGDKRAMDADMKELYQVNGIGHILAISGLHLSFIGFGMYHILRRLSGSFAVGGAAGILFLLCYITMIGLTVSAIRALIMFLFRVGAEMTGRKYDAPTAFAFALAIVILWRPLYIYDGGFWLSFGAVLGALVVIPIFQSLPVQAFWASIGINLIILPILLYFFYEFPLYSVLLNLWVVPLLTILLFLGMTGSILLSLLPNVGGIILGLCKLILAFYEESCRLALRLPFSRIITGQPPIGRIITYYLLLAVLLLILTFYKHKKRKIDIRLYLLSSITILASLLIVMNPLRQHISENMEVTMLDVGQGDGIFIRSPKGTTYLFDGGSSDVKQVGKYRIEPFLKWKGVRNLNYVFVSHGDADHTNGIEEILNRGTLGIPIQNLVLPSESVWDETLMNLIRTAQKAGTKVLIMEQGQMFQDGKVTFTNLHPSFSCEESAGNAASMVLQVTYEAFDLLLTGDVEGEGEEHLAKVNIPEVEVLKVAHHGSKNSTKMELLEQLNPTVALISAGRRNRYGHPHKETKDRLESIGCTLYSTQESGAVMIVTDGTQIQISEYKLNL